MVTKREREGEEGYIRSKGLAKYKYKIDQQEIFTVQQSDSVIYVCLYFQIIFNYRH